MAEMLITSSANVDRPDHQGGVCAPSASLAQADSVLFSVAPLAWAVRREAEGTIALLIR